MCVWYEQSMLCVWYGDAMLCVSGMKRHAMCEWYEEVTLALSNHEGFTVPGNPCRDN